MTVSFFASLSCILLAGLSADAATQASYYVSPSGNDGSVGTLAAPFRTIVKARDAVRGIQGNMTGDIYVYLRGGTYFQTSPIQFTTSDGGTNGHQVIYKAYSSESPVISGATQVTGWTLHSGNIYKATLDRNTKLRSLIVNGVRGRMCASKEITLDPAIVATWGSYAVAGYGGLGANERQGF